MSFLPVFLSSCFTKDLFELSWRKGAEEAGITVLLQLL
jgi:hypothetical protein